jgi:hypothetical protein
LEEEEGEAVAGNSPKSRRRKRGRIIKGKEVPPILANETLEYRTSFIYL